MFFLTATTVTSSGPSLYFQRKNRQASRWFEIKVFLFLPHVLVRLRITRNPLLYRRTISTSMDTTEATGPLLRLGYHFSINWRMQFNVTPSQTSVNKSLQTFKELGDNVLSLNFDVFAHIFMQKKLSDSDLKYVKNLPCFNDVKKQLVVI